MKQFKYVLSHNLTGVEEKLIIIALRMILLKNIQRILTIYIFNTAFKALTFFHSIAHIFLLAILTGTFNNSNKYIL